MECQQIDEQSTGRNIKPKRENPFGEAGMGAQPSKDRMKNGQNHQWNIDGCKENVG